MMFHEFFSMLWNGQFQDMYHALSLTDVLMIIFIVLFLVKEQQ